MKDLLIQTLEPLGFPILQQGSLGEDEPYPDTFLTFWNNNVDGETYYDDEERNYIWDFDLNIYSTNPNIVNSELLKAKELLKGQGFIINGKGHDVISDEPTHTGRGINVKKIE